MFPSNRAPALFDNPIEEPRNILLNIDIFALLREVGCAPSIWAIPSGHIEFGIDVSRLKSK